ncbi:hypothetical protein HYU06_01925 [Candidatus Woesearchaeota archaeon]|nr:hypothetical protein [Candidatus Woesearchaeota archaeon]
MKNASISYDLNNGYDNWVNFTHDKLNTTKDTIIFYLNTSTIERYSRATPVIRLYLKTLDARYFRLIHNLKTIGILSIFYDRGILGYLCQENCFFVIEGKYQLEEPIFMKTWNFGGKVFQTAQKKYSNITDRSFFLRFNPQRRELAELQKVVDSIVLGILSVLIYELFTKNSSNLKSKKDKTRNKKTLQLNNLLNNQTRIKGISSQTLLKLKKIF